MLTLKEGSTGPEVRIVQQKLKETGFDPGNIDGVFGPGTEAAVIAFQHSKGLMADGIVGPATRKALGLQVDADVDLKDITDTVEPQQVARMLPLTPIGNIKMHLLDVLRALKERGLGDKVMVLMALATIRAETEGFEPISEGRSRFNTSPNGHPFDLYDNRSDLGNRGKPDGERFKGRGFVQLTGRFNYEKFGQILGLSSQLVDNPDLANDSKIAADLLAEFLKQKEGDIRAALQRNDLPRARRKVNGGSHGLDRFSDAFRIGLKVIG